MVDPATSESSRQEREREFHDRTYGEGEYDVRPATRFYAVARAGYRFYEDRIHEGAAGLRILEYGCGQGSYAFSLAAAGAHVTGIDISPVAIELAQKQAEDEGVTDQTEFMVMDAEKLDFADDSFDRICGGGILHHIDLDKGYPEIARTLRPGGRAVFLEALGHNPLINAYRNRTPEQRTEDEHPLLEADLELAKRFFDRVDCRFFNLLTIPAFPFARVPGFDRATAVLDAADQRLFDRFPRLRKHAWMVAVELS
jgi:SAM-dependent methyltransferase